MANFVKVRAALAALACLAGVAVTQSAGADPRTDSPASTGDLEKLAQQQTSLLLKHYVGVNVSPQKCGQGQGSAGVDGVFLLPVASYGPGDRAIDCKTTARSVLVDLGGFTITEDNRFPASSWFLNGQDVAFTPDTLGPICEDLFTQGVIAGPMPATLDGGRSITGQRVNSGVFTARVNRHAQIPGDADLYADSVALGHPGRLATLFCGFKAVVHLPPGTHTIVVDYSTLFGASTLFTYDITVRGVHRAH
jgi:hypothetical protein